MPRTYNELGGHPDRAAGKTPEEARQGVTGNGVRYVLAISTAAAVLLLLAITYAFFGPPDLGMDKAQTGLRDMNPPYTAPGGAAPNETPDWQEPAPTRPPMDQPAP